MERVLNRVVRARGHWSAYWERLRASYWFLPALMVTGAIVAARLSLAFDRRMIAGDSLPSVLFGGGVDGAREVLAVVAGSMLTVTSLTFTITIVALQLASSQFGPRVLHNFLRDRGSQLVLGTFVATFTYALIVLRAVRGEEFGDFTPHASVTVTVLLALVSLFVLVYFVNHIAQSIRAEYVVASIGHELRSQIATLYPEEMGEEPPDEPQVLPAEKEVEDLVRANGDAVHAGRTGYVQTIDHEMLIEAAEEADRIVRLEVEPGTFVTPKTVVARMWPPAAGAAPPDLARSVRESFVIGVHRTLVQDATFAASQLAEVAIRSLSPSLNDPNTAMLCVEHLGSGFEDLLGRRIPSPYRYRGNGLRVIAHGPGFVQLFEESVVPIVRYAADAPDVIVRISDVLERLAPHLRRHADWAALSRQPDRIADMVAGTKLRAAERDVVEAAVGRLRRALHRHAPVPVPPTDTDPASSGMPL